MFRRSVIVVGLVCGAGFGFSSTAAASIPSVPPSSTVGLSESAATDELSDGGYSPRVISRNGGGPDCVVFNQSAVADYGQWVEDSETSGTYTDDDEYSVFLSVNCTN